jgi:hypothetical protein
VIHDLKFRDPVRMEIQFATGPFSITSVGGWTVITFSQTSPRVDGLSPNSVSATEVDAMVIARMAMPTVEIDNFIATLRQHQMAAQPTAGNA